MRSSHSGCRIILRLPIVASLYFEGGFLKDHIEILLPDGRQIKLFNNGTWKAVKIKQLDDVVFRSFKWGTPKELIKDVESMEMMWETDDVLSYSGSLAGISARVNFHFCNGALESGMYIFDLDCFHDYMYVVGFYSISDTLSKEYGEPKSNLAWLDDLYRDEESEWGTAIAAGHLVMTNIWNDGQAEVTLICQGDHYDITLCLSYVSNHSRNQ